MSTVLAPPPVESAAARAERILSGDLRPSDYLPVTDRVRFLTDREMTYAREGLKGVEPDPCVERRQLHQNLLLVHHPEEHVGYLEDDTGIVVLVTGLDEIAEFIRTVEPDLWDGRLTVGFPDPYAAALGSW